jgi:hypothetical protein
MGKKGLNFAGLKGYETTGDGKISVISAQAVLPPLIFILIVSPNGGFALMDSV